MPETRVWNTGTPATINTNINVNRWRHWEVIRSNDGSRGWLQSLQISICLERPTLVSRRQPHFGQAIVFTEWRSMELIGTPSDLDD